MAPAPGKKRRKLFPIADRHFCCDRQIELATNVFIFYYF